MAELSDIQRLIEELGPANPDISSVVQYDDTSWAVAYDGVNSLLLEWEGASEKLVLTAEVGQPEEARRLEVAEAALGINTLWQDHGGIWFGRTSAEGTIVMMYALQGPELDLELLRTVVDNFAVKARVWRDYVLASQPGAAMPDFAGPANALRV